MSFLAPLLSSVGWTTADMPDQTGRTVIVTGGNSGLGYETAKALAHAGATVILAVRTTAKGEAAAERVRSSIDGAGSVSVIELDLADLASVESTAKRLLADLDQLDLCINNAGVMATPPSLTSDGIELQFASNHLGHFAFTGRLLPLLLAAPGSRVVSVSSLAANSGSLVDHDPTSLEGYERFAIYGTTKLANQAFTAELGRRLKAAGADAIAVAAHPGLSHTNLSSGYELPFPIGHVLKGASRVMTQPASIGALPTLRAATDPDVQSGDYFGPALPGEAFGLPKKLSLLDTATDAETGRRLWEQSIDLSGVSYQELQ